MKTGKILCAFAVVLEWIAWDSIEVATVATGELDIDFPITARSFNRWLCVSLSLQIF